MGDGPRRGVDGLNPSDPGIALLELALAEAEPGQTLLCYCGDVPASSPACTRLILDLRERVGARHPCVEPNDVARLEGRFSDALVWPRAHLGLDFSRETLATAAYCVAAGGRIWLSARKQKGLKRLTAALADVCDEVQTVKRSKGYHLVMGVRGSAPVDPDPEAYEIDEPIVGPEALISAAGTFSRRALDEGTRILLHFAEHKLELGPEAVELALDIGAGVGPVSVYMLRRFPNARVISVETNLRALTCLEANVEGFGERAEVWGRDGLGPPPPHYAGAAQLVLTNPPTHAPPEVLNRLLGDTREWMAPGGVAAAVVSRPGRAAEAFDAVGAQVHIYEVGSFHIVVARF